MKQNQKRFSSLILAVLFLIAAMIIFFDLLQPAYGDLQMLKGKDLSEQNFIDNEQQLVTQVKGLIASYDGQASGQQSVALALPVGQNIAAALAQISGLASVNNIALKNISISSQAPQAQPAAPATAAGATGGIASAAAGGAIVKPLGTISFQVTADGSYEGFKNFIQGIENNIRIFDLKSVTIHSDPVSFGKVSNQDNFSYDLSISTYYQSQ